MRTGHESDAELDALRTQLLAQFEKEEEAARQAARVAFAERMRVLDAEVSALRAAKQAAKEAAKPPERRARPPSNAFIPPNPVGTGPAKINKHLAIDTETIRDLEAKGLELGELAREALAVASYQAKRYGNRIAFVASHPDAEKHLVPGSRFQLVKDEDGKPCGTGTAVIRIVWAGLVWLIVQTVETDPTTGVEILGRERPLAYRTLASRYQALGVVR